MLEILAINMKGIFRDRVYYGILSIAILLLLIPQLSSLSMRIVTELSITLSLSLISFILLLLAVFVGGTSLWKDMDRRYSFSVLGLPVSRSAYLLGKFAASVVLILATLLFLGLVAYLVVWWASEIYPPQRPIVWINLLAALSFTGLKYVMLVAVAYLFATVSTSFFLPIFGTIVIFFTGSASQEAYDYVHTENAASLPPLIKHAASSLYYILPNFSSFDLNVNAIYGVPLSPRGVLLTVIYSLVYTGLLLWGAVMIFSRREMK